MGFDSIKNRILPKTSSIKVAVSGITGSGKSSVLNKMVNDPTGQGTKQHFKEGDTPESETADPVTLNFDILGLKVYLTDKPGFLDSGGSESDKARLRSNFLDNEKKKYNVLLHCIPVDGKFDAREQACINVAKQVFGADCHKYIVFCFTGADRQHGLSDVPSVLVGNNLPYLTERLFDAIADIVEARPDGFEPRQVVRQVKYVHESSSSDNCCIM